MILWRQTDRKDDPSAADKRVSQTASPGNTIVPTPGKPHARHILDGDDQLSYADDALEAAIKTIAFSFCLPPSMAAVSLGEGVEGGKEGV